MSSVSPSAKVNRRSCIDPPSGSRGTTGIETCLFYDPDGGDRPTIQLYCAPIVYQDRDVQKARPTWGVTFTSCLLR